MPVNTQVMTTGLALQASVSATPQFFQIQPFDSNVTVQVDGGEFISWLSDTATAESAPDGAAEWAEADFAQHSQSGDRPREYLGVAAKDGDATLTAVRVQQEAR